MVLLAPHLGRLLVAGRLRSLSRRRLRDAFIGCDRLGPDFDPVNAIISDTKGGVFAATDMQLFIHLIFDHRRWLPLLLVVVGSLVWQD